MAIITLNGQLVTYNGMVALDPDLCDCDCGDSGPCVEAADFTYASSSLAGALTKYAGSGDVPLDFCPDDECGFSDPTGGAGGAVWYGSNAQYAVWLWARTPTAEECLASGDTIIYCTVLWCCVTAGGSACGGQCSPIYTDACCSETWDGSKNTLNSGADTVTFA